MNQVPDRYFTSFEASMEHDSDAAKENAPKRVTGLNLGCKTNRYETDAVLADFMALGYTQVNFHEEADVYIINTCSVTGEAGRKSGQMVRRARKQNPHAVVIAMGCHVELGAESLGADILVGNQGKTRVPALLGEWLAKNPDGRKSERLNFRAIAGSLNSEREPAYEEFTPQVVQSESRGIIKIQDGCNNFCTYCAIPMARGRVRSRSEAAILKEVANLADYGFSEMVLTGIHICSYGQDWKDTADIGNTGQARCVSPMLDLLDKMSAIPGVRRLRLGSVEPKSVTPAFAERLAKINGLCPHVHLSLQSGAGRTLERMNRRYTAEEYRIAVRDLRQALPAMNLTTDIIVGFPGETEADHQESLAFAEEMGFGRIHVFRYSVREGTAAAKFKDRVPGDVLARRSEDFFRLAVALRSRRQKDLIGQTAELLLESQHKDGSWLGYTEAYDISRMYFDGDSSDYVGAEGDIWQVEIMSAKGDEIICKPLRRLIAGRINS